MTLNKVKEIEEHINMLLETYDEALRVGDMEMSVKALEVIDYELAKLDENEIKLSTIEEIKLNGIRQ